MTRVTFGKSRVRESRMPGSVRAKAEWLSYSTTIDFRNRTYCIMTTCGSYPTRIGYKGGSRIKDNTLYVGSLAAV
jgi:hypothetical protein